MTAAVFGGYHGTLDPKRLIGLRPLVRVELGGVKGGRVSGGASRCRRLREPVAGVAARITIFDERRHVEVSQRHDLPSLIPNLVGGGDWHALGTALACSEKLLAASLVRAGMWRWPGDQVC